MRHNGTPKCAWESDLNRLPQSPTRGARTIIPDVWLCFVLFGGGVPVYDYIGGFLIVYCINLTELFDPCGTCSDGKQCQISDGEAECVYECGADEVGGGQTRCQACDDGEVPNADGTACETCEHGESSTAGACNPDPCEGVTCPDNAHCKRWPVPVRRGLQANPESHRHLRRFGYGARVRTRPMPRRGLRRKQFLFEWCVPVRFRLRRSRQGRQLREALHKRCL